MGKIKLLHITNSINLGGGARNIRTFYKYAPDNIEFHVIALLEKGEKYKEFSRICSNLSFANKKTNYVIEYVKNNKIEIVHFHGAGILSEKELKIARSVKAFGVKIVYTNIFGEYSLATDKLVDFYIFKSNHCLVEKFAKNSDINVLNEDSYKRYMVIPNPVDYKYFESIRPSKKQIEDYKKEIAIPNDYNLIGKVGARKAVEKWSDLILYMFPYVLKKHPNTLLLIQGLPDSRRKWVSKFGDKVRLLPQTNDDKQLALMYNVLDIFTHASKIGEHSGNSINEAMYWGKPVIVNLTPKKDNGQFEQVVHGKNGFFANTPKGYAFYTNKLISGKDLIKKMGNTSQTFAKNNNNPTNLWEDLYNIYCYLVIGRKPENFKKQYESTLNYSKNYKTNLKLYYSNNFIARYMFSKIFWKLKDYKDHNL